MINVDYCVFGGGMIGSAAALGLARLGYSVAVVEAQEPHGFDPTELPDLRVSALNRYTQKLLADYAVWDDVLAMRAQAYNKLSVWEQANSALHFEAAELGESYLGHFVENRVLQLALLNKLKSDYASKVSIHYSKAKHVKLGFEYDKNNEANVQLGNGEAISARCLIAADGGFSQLRDIASIGITGWQYKQKANVFLVKMKADFEPQTWQEFTPNGPLAFLPLFNGYASLVWYADVQQSSRLATATLLQCKEMIVQAFPPLLADFDLLDKISFGLRRMHANQYWRENLVLLGDAAHQINPLAGQGVNLGFKDVGALIESIKINPISIASQQAFVDYERARRPQNLLMMTAMDGFYHTFSNNIRPLKRIRNLGVKAANAGGFLKQRVLKYAMGIE
ncbi:FAD-dependent monooxygenase [Glaciecola sp. MH2013]|uniref:FAD-dependent monooxygenase n=1 Tax=Glaciecola sp. MH2013 TaxID=2785524 RepID=UPI001E4BD11C|nr:FAD-dependent monooxygenase [Glaciecola sp. MH2013]